MRNWTPKDIRRAVEDKGETLTGLATKTPGLHPAACRRALHARNIPGETAISAFIGHPVWELWPERWNAPTEPGGQPTRIDNRRSDTGA